MRPDKILTSKYKCHSFISNMPNFMDSTFASNQPCLVGLSSSGSGSVNTPNSEFAAASTHISIFSLPSHGVRSDTLVLAKFGSHIEPLVIPCSATPSLSKTSPSPEKSNSATTGAPFQ